MKRTFLYSLVLLGLSTLLVQCVATQKDMDYANVQMRKVDSRVEVIDKEVSELKKQTVKEVRERQAETGDLLDYHQSEILRLQSELEENNFLIQQIQKENKEMKKLLLSRIETSEKNSAEEINLLKDRLALTEEQLLKAYDRLAFAENEIKSIKNSISEEASKRAMEAAQRAREAERKARLAAEREAAEKQKSTRRTREILPEPYKIDVSSQNITGTAEEKEVKKVVSKPVAKTVQPPPATATSYDRGMTLYKQKKYRDAYNSFAEYLDNNRTGSQAVNARYYAAQSLYEDKDYELAILEFQKVIVEHPQDSLAPKSLYKQGLSFEKIGDPETARIVYNKLVDSYPKSAEANSAKTRLEALKK
ncbi:MAG: tetratricopeptide repeat protein [Desulfobacterales bacterium]|nr:tetratricopeptide repeat protein [Desulfobacterales bacterium]